MNRVHCSFWLLCFFLAVCFNTKICAQAPAIQEKANPVATKRLVALFESRYRAAHTLQATFLERYTESGRLLRTEAGVAYFRRPGKMRWEYEEPEKNLFLVDGKWAWFYVPADHTVTRVPAKESSDWRTPLALLAGEMKVSRVCARVEATEEEKPEKFENAVLRCILRGEDSKPGQPPAMVNDEIVYFEIVQSTGELVRVVVRKTGGVGIEFHFANWVMDPVLPDSRFHFEAPMGVAIVNGELPTGEGSKN